MAVINLVTGGAGFIGSNLVRFLVKKGESVRVLDNLSTGNIDNLDDVLTDITFIEGDIRDFETIQMATKGATYVFHQAALPSVPRSIEDPFSCHETNITGTLNILLAAHDNRVKRVIYASSSSIYGDTPDLPKKESMPPSPLSPYALSKLTGEYYCKIFTSVYRLETIILRYFNVFGPKQNPESQYAAVIPKFIKSLLLNKAPTIYGDGEQTRDFTFVENVISANILASKAKKTSGEIINIATGVRVSINRLLEVLKEIMKKKISSLYDEPRRGDVRHSLADISEANRILGYYPEIDFKEGLRRTISAMRSV